MGKKDTGQELDELDALLADLDSIGDIDTNDDSGDDRKPYLKVVKDIKNGIINNFTMEPKEKAVKFIETAMPRGIIEEYNFTKSVYGDVKEVYDKNIDEIRGNVKSVVDLVKSKTGEDSKITKLLGKLSDKLTTEKTSSYRYSGPTEEEIITNTLNDLFIKERKIDDITNRSREIGENNRFEKNVELNHQVISNLETISFFHKEYTLNYYKKSIELKLKTLFINKELLDVTKTTSDVFTKQFEAIVKNTSLPDLVKYKNTEQLGETIQQRARDNMADMFFSAARPLEVMKKNIMNKISNTVGNVKSGLEMGVSMGDTASAMGDMGGMVSKTEMATGFAADKMSDVIAEYTSRKLEDLPAVRHILKSIKLGMADPTSTFYDLSDKALDKNTVTSRWLSRLYRGVGALSQTSAVENIRMLENAPDQETFFDYRTKNSIVKIIPMLLSKIYGEVKGLRTGGEPEGIYYDYSTGKLEDNLNLKTRLTKNISNALGGVAGSNLDRFINLLDNTGDLDEETKRSIKATLLGHLSKGGSISPASLQFDEFTDKLDEKDRDIFLSKYGQLMSRMGDDVRLVDDVKDALYNIKTNTPFIDKLVEEYYRNGQIAEIDKMGLVDYNEITGAYTVNNDAYRDMLTKIVKGDDFNTDINNINNEETNGKHPFNPSLKDDLDKVKDSIINKATSISDNIINKVNDTIGSINTDELKEEITKKITTVSSGVVKNVDVIKEELKEKSLLEIYKEQNFNLTNIKADIKNRGNKLSIPENIKNNPNIVKSLEVLSNNVNKLVEKEQVQNTKDIIKTNLPIIQKVVEETATNLHNKTNNAFLPANVKGSTYIPNFKMFNSSDNIKNTLKNSYGMVNGLSFNSIMDPNYIKDANKDNLLLENKTSKLTQVLKLEKVEATSMYEAYQESKDFLNGIDFMSWAKGIGYKNVNGSFIKMPEDMRISKMKDTMVNYLEKHVKGLSGKDIKGKFTGIKKLFDIEPGMTPLQILHKVLTKTREWDRKIMKAIPRTIGKLFKGAFNLTKGVFKGGTSLLMGSGTANLFRVLAGKAPIYKNEKGEDVSEQPEFSNKQNVEKTVASGSFFSFLKDKLSGKKEKVFGDSDGDGDTEGSWEDRFQKANETKSTDKTPKAVPVGPDKKSNKLFEFLGFFKDKLMMIPKLLLGLLTGVKGLATLPKLLGGILGATKFVGKGIGLLGSAIGTMLGGAGKVAGVLMGGKVAEYVLDKDKAKVDIDKNKVDIDKDIKTNPIDPKSKVEKPKGTKILETLKSFKEKIVAKLGKKASVGVLARLGAKIASRLVPFAGAALLAYDGSMIAIDMIKNGTSLESAISKQILGFDLFNDDEPVLDEDGNPIKPDEDLVYEEGKDIATEEYTKRLIALNKKETKTGIKDETERAKLEVMKRDYKLKDEDIARKYNELLEKENGELKNTGTATDDINKANKDTTDKINQAISNVEYDSANNTKYVGASKDDIGSSIFGNVVAKNNGMVNQWSNNSSAYAGGNGPSIGAGSTLAGQLDLTKGSFDPIKGKEAIDKLLNDVSTKTGVDANTLKVFAAIESGMNPNAKASTSSASGLFQFIKSTWNNMISKYGSKYGIGPGTSPFDPTANALMGAEYIKENKDALSSVKKNINTTDLYMAHFLGAGGARQFLSAPQSAIAAQMMPKAASANPNIFFTKNGQARTIREVYELMQQKVSKSAKGFGFKATVSNMTTGEPAKVTTTPPSVVDTPVEGDNKIATDTNNTSSTNANYVPADNEVIQPTTVSATSTSKTPYSSTDMANGFMVNKMNSNKPITKPVAEPINTVTTSSNSIMDNPTNKVLSDSYEIQKETMGYIKGLHDYFVSGNNNQNTGKESLDVDKSPLFVNKNKANTTSLDLHDSLVDLGKKRYG